jgi:hypothetical protein
VLPTLCTTFRPPIQKKNSVAEEKNSVPSKFPFLKEFGKNTIFVCVSGKITIFLGHFPRIREDKRSETILLRVGPFVQNRPKFENLAAELSGRYNFNSALFDLCSRTIGQLATLLHTKGSDTFTIQDNETGHQERISSFAWLFKDGTANH